MPFLGGPPRSFLFFTAVLCASTLGILHLVLPIVAFWIDAFSLLPNFFHSLRCFLFPKNNSFSLSNCPFILGFLTLLLIIVFCLFFLFCLSPPPIVPSFLLSFLLTLFCGKRRKNRHKKKGTEKVQKMREKTKEFLKNCAFLAGKVQKEIFDKEMTSQKRDFTPHFRHNIITINDPNFVLLKYYFL